MMALVRLSVANPMAVRLGALIWDSAMWGNPCE